MSAGSLATRPAWAPETTRRASMRGTPHSIWLSWANRAAGCWIGTATAEVLPQQGVR
jgi:hypothetical protein